MNLRHLLPLSASAAILSSAGWASAERPWPHFRYGAALGVGPLIVPGQPPLGALDLNPQAGIQLNQYLGVYAAAFLGVMFPVLSAQMGVGAFIEVTFSRTISVGIGGELDWYNLDGSKWHGGPITGRLPGGRLRFTWAPEFLHLEAEQLTVVTFGVDVRLLGASTFYFERSRTPVGPVAIVPQLTVGVLSY